MAEKFKARKGQKPVRLASTSGHVVNVGDDWVDVPDQLVPEAMRSGLVSYDLYEAALAEAKAEAAGGGGDKQESDAMPETERREKVLLAIRQILELTEAGETATPGGKGLVTAAGVPMVGAVSEFAGFKVAAAEIEDALR